MACEKCDPESKKHRTFIVGGCWGKKSYRLPYALNGSDSYFAAISQTGVSSCRVMVLAGLPSSEDDPEQNWCKLYITEYDVSGLVDHREYNFKDPRQVEEVAPIPDEWQQWMLADNRVKCEAGQDGEKTYTISDKPEPLTAILDSPLARFSNVLVVVDITGQTETEYRKSFILDESDKEKALTYPQMPEGQSTTFSVEIKEPVKNTTETKETKKGETYDIRVKSLILEPGQREVAEVVAGSAFVEKKRR